MVCWAMLPPFVMRTDLRAPASHRRGSSFQRPRPRPRRTRYAPRPREPLTKAALKERLAQAGYPAERLSNYFYTVLGRIKEKEHIALDPDGRVRINNDILG